MAGMSFSEWVHKRHLDDEVGPHCVKEGDTIRLLVSRATAEKYLLKYNDDPAEAAAILAKGECVVTSLDDNLVVAEGDGRHVTLPRKLVRRVV